MFEPLPNHEPWRVVLADPPWSFKTMRGTLNGLADKQYQCLSIGDIAALPVRDVGAANCALFLWVPSPMLVEGKHLPVLEAWNFRPVTLALVWHKLFGNGAPYLGMGFYTRSGTEMCVLGIRGRMPRKPTATGVAQVVTAPRRRHSQKPDEQYDRIEALYDGPYLELFARARRPGWVAWGNQVALEVDDG